MASVLPNGKQQYFNNDGSFLNGGSVTTYQAGTLTPKNTFSDAEATTPNPNPIPLNARGEALIFWSGSYDIVVKDALGNIIYSVQGITETNAGYRTAIHGSVIVPTGTTVQRDNPASPGYFRYNVDTNAFEGYYDDPVTPGWKSMLKQVNTVDLPADGNLKLKSIRGNSILGTGDIPAMYPLISGENLKTINGDTILESGNLNLQETLVSGTNIKTLNGTPILGSGDISTSPPAFAIYSQLTLGGF